MARPAATNQYLTTQVLTARPEELRLMLLDGAVRFARQGREGMATKNFEASFNGFSRCRDIVFELMNTMRPDANPALVSRLTALYGYMISRLLQASSDRDAAKADEVIRLLEFERETWSQLINKLAAERSAVNQPARAPVPAAGGDPADPATSCLSIEG